MSLEASSICVVDASGKIVREAKVSSEPEDLIAFFRHCPFRWRGLVLAVHEVLLQELNGFEKHVRKLARSDARARLLMTAPGVGPIVGLTYVAAIDDPARFSSSKTVGAHFGMTPKKYQSGEIDVTGRISKTGDKGVRAVLYEAAHIILTMPVKGHTR